MTSRRAIGGALRRLRPVAWGAGLLALALVAAPLPAAAEGAGSAEAEESHGSALPDEPLPLQLEGFPQRPRYLLELGNPYLGTEMPNCGQIIAD